MHILVLKYFFFLFKHKEYTNKDVGLVLPSSAFESYIEEPIGLLNRAPPISGKIV